MAATARDWSEDLEVPAPLEFFTEDKIDPANAQIIQEEAQRWRRLSWLQRVMLRRRIARLARQLRRAGYLALEQRLADLRTEIRALKQQYRHHPSPERKSRILRIIEEATPLLERFEELQADYQRYQHLVDWLEYERNHHAELVADDKREKHENREMFRESRWLEQIFDNVFRYTPGCHHTYKTRENGRQITRTPRFERCVIRPDAHYFYLETSKRFLFGWRWRLPPGVLIARLIEEDVLTQLRAATKRQVAVQWTDSNQLVFRVSRLDSPDALPRLVRWQDAMDYLPADEVARLPYCIGMREDRKFTWLNFADDPHMLVAGKTQSGKSNLVNAIIATLAMTHTPEQLRFVLIDQKGGIEFTHWRDLPHVHGEMVRQFDGVEPMLSKIVRIMQDRQALLERVKAKNVNDFNKRSADTMSRIFVVIDELNTIVGHGRLTSKIHNLIALLASQGRAVGIHVIACTQHPSVDVIPGRIKTNLPVRISGPMPSVSSSMIVLDTQDAAKLPDLAGRLCVVVGLRKFVVQSPLITDEDIAFVVSSCLEKYPDVDDRLTQGDDQTHLKVWDRQNVLSACIDLIGGHLGGQKLHKLLGDESPGERYLSQVMKELSTQLVTDGYLIRADTGEKYVRKKKRGKGVYLEPAPDNPDRSDA